MTPESEAVKLLLPSKIQRNRENPRLIFHQEELEELEKSIKLQGILVPLTVFRENSNFVLLDGERRWRCALKLGLSSVPAIIQPKPDRMTNIMMMFAIHNARKDWDPLPAAMKLGDLEKLFVARYGKPPTEAQLANVASMSRGEVRRLKKLLALPQAYREELLIELQKPRSEQEITVDHVIEVTKGVGSLRSQKLLDEKGEDILRHALLRKFRTKVIKNTVAPRKLVSLAKAVKIGEVTRAAAHELITRLINEPKFGVEEAYEFAVADLDFQRGLQSAATRLAEKLMELRGKRRGISADLAAALELLAKEIAAIQR